MQNCQQIENRAERRDSVLFFAKKENSQKNSVNPIEQTTNEKKSHGGLFSHAFLFLSRCLSHILQYKNSFISYNMRRLITIYNNSIIISKIFQPFQSR